MTVSRPRGSSATSNGRPVSLSAPSERDDRSFILTERGGEGRWGGTFPGVLEEKQQQ